MDKLIIYFKLTIIALIPLLVVVSCAVTVYMRSIGG